VGSKLFHTDRHDKANSHSSQFCESAYTILTLAWKNLQHLRVSIRLTRNTIVLCAELPVSWINNSRNKVHIQNNNMQLVNATRFQISFPVSSLFLQSTFNSSRRKCSYWWSSKYFLMCYRNISSRNKFQTDKHRTKL